MIKVKFKSNNFKVLAKAKNINEITNFKFTLLVYTDKGQQVAAEELDEYVLSEILEESFDNLNEEYYNKGMSF